MDQKESPRPGGTICRQYPGIRFVTDKREPEKVTKIRKSDLSRIRVGLERATKTRGYDLLRTFVMDKRGSERSTKTRKYDLLRIRVGQKEPPRPGGTICHGQEWARKSHQEPGLRFVTDKRGPEKATKTRGYDSLWIRVGQKEPPRPGGTICSGQEEPPRPGDTIYYG